LRKTVFSFGIWTAMEATLDLEELMNSSSKDKWREINSIPKTRIFASNLSRIMTLKNTRAKT
jgi:hypothetical protein